MNNRITVIEGDITRLEVDAVVNAANQKLAGGGGVDGAIHKAAGRQKLHEACREIGFCPTGEARITPGFGLRARFIIHTVGPRWKGGERQERELLSACYRNSLSLAVEHEITSIAFPCISTGVYRFPAEQACGIAISEVREFLSTNTTLNKVIFCCYSAIDASQYRATLQ